MDTEETEIEKNEFSEDPTNTTPSLSGSLEINKNVISNTETTTLKSDEGSGTKTPSLDVISMRHADAGFYSFSGSGVSAEPLESETAPKPEEITHPYELIDGTTIYYDTDGSQSETKDTIPQTLSTPSPEVHVSLDSPSVLPPDVTTEIPSSSEASNDKSNGDTDVATEAEESSGDIYQYISNWISEGSGNVEEIKSEEEEDEEEEEEEENYKEEEVDGKEEEEEKQGNKEKEDEDASGEIKDNIVPEKNDLPTPPQENGELKTKEEPEAGKESELNVPESEKSDKLESVHENETISEESAPIDTTNKEQVDQSQDVNIEELKSESATMPDVQNNTEEVIDDNMKNEATFDELKQDSIVNTQLNDKGGLDNKEQIDEGKVKEEVMENLSNEDISISVNTTGEILEDSLKTDEVNDSDKKEVNEEISLVSNIMPNSKLIINEEVVELYDLDPKEADNIEKSSQNNEVKPDNDIQDSVLNTESINNLENEALSENQSSFASLGEEKSISEPLPISENENTLETSSKDSQTDTDSAFETTASSGSDETVEGFTEPSIIEDLTVPTYELPTEITNVPSVDISPDSSIIENNEDGILKEQLSVESSGGYFYWVTNLISNIFGGSSSDVNVPEEANESEIEDSIEAFIADDSEKDIKKRDVELNNFWDTPHKKDSSSCKFSKVFQYCVNVL